MPAPRLDQDERPDSAAGMRRIGLISGLRASFSHELRMHLFSPVTYIFQIGFLVLLSVCVFLVSDYYNEDEASLTSMLNYLPWLALLLVPALAMRAWPSEHEDRATELLLTMPLPLPALVLGKFLAGFAVLCITLAFSVALPATAIYLGVPDDGALVAGYLGAALLMGSYYALSLLGAALAREPLSAFVVSIALIAFLLLLGWDTAGRELQGLVPAGVIAVLPLYSPAHNLTNLGRGLIDAASLGYFLVVTLVALAATVCLVALQRRRGGWRALGQGAAVLAATAAALALAVPGAARLPWSLDLTDEQEFTLDAGTRGILDELPAGAEVTLYWSASQANVPNYIKAHARRLRDLLRVMSRQAKGGLDVRLVDPVPDSEEELAALRAGIRRVPMSSGDYFYLGAVVADGDRVGRIPYFDVRRTGLLEYDLALALEGLSRERTPKIGILSPLVPPLEAAQRPQGFSFIDELQRNYDVAIIPFFAEEIPKDLDALLLIDATLLKKRTLFAIDQYLMAGGSVIVLIDPYLRARPQNNMAAPEPSAEINDISDLLVAYGIGYDSQSVVGDSSVAAQVRDRDQTPLAYPYWLRLWGPDLSSSHPVTAGLNELLLAEPGAFTIADRAAVQPLILTGNASGVIARGDLGQSTPRQLALDFETDGARRVLAAVRQGRFKSAYAGGPEAAAPEFLAESRAPAVLFAVADVDWILDDFAVEERSLGDDTIVRPLNDNLAFLLNLVSYASGNEALIGIRGRGRVNRNFTRVEQLFREAELRLRAKEAASAQQVAELENSLRAMVEAGDDAGNATSDAWQQKVGAQEADLLAARRALRRIRSRIRQDVDQLGQRLIVANLVAGPLLVLLFFGLVATARHIRQRRAIPAVRAAEVAKM